MTLRILTCVAVVVGDLAGWGLGPSRTAFARIHEREAVLVVAARLTCTLCRGDDAMWTPALWQGTTVGCGAEGAGVRRFRRWRNWLTGAELVLGNDDEAAIDLQALFAGAGGLPFAVLVAEGEAAP